MEEVIMEDLMNVASYIYNRYETENGTRIDEMKLHKLMYFSQRESLIQDSEPLQRSLLRVEIWTDTKRNPSCLQRKHFL